MSIRDLLLSVALVASASLTTVTSALAFSGVVEVPHDTLPPDVEQTVIVRNQAVLTDPTVDISLRKVLKAIINSSGGSSKAERITPELLLQTMISSFSLTSAVNNGVTMPLTPRLGAAAMLPVNMLDPGNDPDGMHPIAVVNRFDLAPADFSTCGQVRIIYIKGLDRTTTRMSMIFEASVPNPHPSTDPVVAAAGCLPLTQYWAGLQTKTGTLLSKAVEDLLFNGIPTQGFPAVVAFANYGNPLGQVRVNMFDLQNPVWQLRQFAVVPSGKTIRFTPRPVSDTTWPVLYRDDQPGEPASVTALRADFRADYLGRRVRELLKQDSNALATGSPLTDLQLITGMGSSVPTRFSAFESTSQPQFNNSDAPLDNASVLLSSSVGAAVTSIPSAWPLTAEQVFNRDGAGTCGGCHMFSNGTVVAPSDSGGEIRFARSIPFLHVDGNGFISQNLSEYALPMRAQILAGFNQSSANLRTMNPALLAPTNTTRSVSAKTSLCTSGCADPVDAFVAKGRAFNVGGSH